MENLGKYLFTASLTLTCAAALAMPPRPGQLSIRQPDGSVIEAKLVGDRHRCMYVSPQGKILRPDSRGMLVPTEELFSSRDNHRAAVQDQSTSPSRATTYPTKGKIKALIILAEFADSRFMSENAADLIGRMLSEEGFGDNGATGSVRDYFAASSFGAFDLEPVVLGPVTLPNGMAYYGAPSGTNADVRPEEMIRDACSLVDDDVDFSEFDLDSDGYIDNVYVFYPGYSQADGAPLNTIWPHSGFAYNKLRAVFDGVCLDKYACSNEIDISTNKLVGIGTFCHEFSHVLGLPDLYATDYSNEEHPGTWSLMASGGRNNNGHTPPLFSAYERYALGWLEPQTAGISEQDYTLSPEENSAFIIPTSSKDEYYIIENRQRSGWDRYLPGHGMLVWHIDYDETAWKKNYVNNDANHQRIDLIEADRSSSEDSRPGDSFPGSADVRELEVMKTWTGTPLNLGLFNIREDPAGTVTFSVASTEEMLPAPEGIAATEISPVSFLASWKTVPQATAYVLEVYRKVREGSVLRKEYVEGYRLFMAGDNLSATIKGLEPSTEYFYIVRAMGGGHISAYSPEQSVTTLEPDFRSAIAECSAATEISGTGFTANWKPLEGATGYILTVSEVTLTPSATHLNDFADEIMAPTGWYVTPGCTTGSFTGYYGSAAPGLSLPADGAMIQTPLEEDMIETLSFWYRGIRTESRHCITIYGYDGSAWRELKELSPLETDKSGAMITLSEEFSTVPCYAARIVFGKPTSKGTLALDDIKVEHCGAVCRALDGYNGVAVGNTLSAKVEGLAPSTLYRYTVTASDGNFQSLPSLPSQLRTTDSSGTVTTPADTASSCEITSVNGNIIVRNLSSQPVGVEIFNVSGNSLFRQTATSGEEISVSVLQGVYIVSAGDISRKIAIH